MKRMKLILATGAFLVVLVLAILVLNLPKKENNPIGHVVCGNGLCERGETAGSCTQDCRITEPWITATSSKRYFMFENGTGFFPVGTALNGAFVTYDATEQQFIDYFKSMKEHGENFLRIDLEGFSWGDNKEQVAQKIKSGVITFLENPPGTFSEAYAQRIDKLIALAEQYGVYLELVLPSHSCTLFDKFDLYPYSKSKGGPATSLIDFRSNAQAKELFKQRIRYVVDRWGGKSHVFIWELYNEINIPGCGKGDGQESAAWAKEMGDYLRGYEYSKYGKAHLIGLSSGDFYMQDPAYGFFFTTTGTDVLQSHYYVKTRMERNPVISALDVGRTVPYLLQQASYSKPYLENERRTLIPDFEASQNMQTVMTKNANDMEHNAIWAYLASGAAGGGATWSGIIHVPTSVAETASTLKNFIQYVNFSAFDSRPYASKITSSDPDVLVFSTGDGKTVVGWLLHNDTLDYDIDLIDYGRGLSSIGSNDSLDTKLTLLVKWKGVLENAGFDVDWEGYINQISEAIIKASGADKSRADNATAALLRDPGNFITWTAGPMLEKVSPEIRQALVADMTNITNGIWTDFEAIESEKHVLRDAYKGYPEVSANITISGLIDSGHELILYNDTAGEEIHQENVSGATVTFETPGFSKHLAFVIRSIN